MHNYIFLKRSILFLMLAATLLPSCTTGSKKPGPAMHTVQLKEMRFDPAELSIHAGDTVEWINNDFVDHDITEAKNKTWSSGVLKTGQSWKTVIKQSTDYYCSIHVVMKGKLIVNEK